MKAPTADPPIELYDVSEEQNSGGKLKKLTARKNLKIVITCINQFVILIFLIIFF